MHLVVELLHDLGLLLVYMLVLGLILALPTGWPVKHSAVSSRLTLASWPSTRRQLLAFLRRAGRGLVLGFGWGLIWGLVLGVGVVLADRLLMTVLLLGLASITDFGWLAWAVGEVVHNLGVGLLLGLGFALSLGLGFGLLEPQSVLLTSRTPKEARSRSLIAALTWLVSGWVGGLVFGRGEGLLAASLFGGLVFGSLAGLDLALRNGGWFVLLQKVAHRRLARAGNLPSRPYDFMRWGIEKQIFRGVGGGVRFRHDFIQQHLAKASEGAS
jgi:hypothetical protein